MENLIIVCLAPIFLTAGILALALVGGIVGRLLARRTVRRFTIAAVMAETAASIAHKAAHGTRRPTIARAIDPATKAVVQPSSLADRLNLLASPFFVSSRWLPAGATVTGSITIR